MAAINTTYVDLPSPSDRPHPRPVDAAPNRTRVEISVRNRRAPAIVTVGDGGGTLADMTREDGSMARMDDGVAPPSGGPAPGPMQASSRFDWGIALLGAWVISGFTSTSGRMPTAWSTTRS